MKVFNLLYLLLLLVAVVASRPHPRPDFMRRRFHRHYCLHRRCLALHSRVPFP